MTIEHQILFVLGLLTGGILGVIAGHWLSISVISAYGAIEEWISRCRG